jgi:hypothetical protein
VYPVAVTFPHREGTVEIEFSARGLTPNLVNEGWGIDNVRVEALPAPRVHEAERLEALWADLAGEDPVRAVEAMWEIVSAGDRGAAFLRERVEATEAVRARIARELFALDMRRFEPFRDIASDDDAAARKAYLEGRLLQVHGRSRDAIARFEAMPRADRSHGPPSLRWAECLRADGEPEKAQARIRDALSAGADDPRPLVELWFEISALDLGRTGQEILASLPDTPGGKEARPFSDLRWVLEGLRDHRAIRVNCGGGERTSPEGIAWGEDRLFISGRKSRDRNPDDPVHGTARTFSLYGSGPHGYRIPMPPGRYRVILSLTKRPSSRNGQTVFDVAIEGRRFLVNHQLEATGHAVTRPEAAVSVTDGFLDIEFIPNVGTPRVSAMEIISLD